MAGAGAAEVADLQGWGALCSDRGVGSDEGWLISRAVQWCGLVMGVGTWNARLSFPKVQRARCCPFRDHFAA